MRDIENLGGEARFITADVSDADTCGGWLPRRVT
jgi:hypothetical protein